VTQPLIAIVEDDAELQTVLCRGLREEGFQAEAVGSGAALFERLERAAPDALVIDIGLPDADGRDLCQALRARGVQAPVLFLTGANDPRVDPMQSRKMTARLQAAGGPAALFVQTAARFRDTRVEVLKDGLARDAKSILSVLTLGVSQGTTITVRADGPQAEAALTALADLVNRDFDE